MEGVALDDRRIALERARGVWPERVATDYLDRWVAEKPDATALVAWRLEEEAETRLTYRELAARVAGTAAALERAGVRQGDVVSIQLPNWWEFVVLYLATVRLGAVANALMPIFRYRELAARVAGTAAALERAGVRQGDVVSIQLPNWWEFVVLYLATVRLGAVTNALMPIFRHRELSFMLRQAGSRVFVAPERFRGFDHGSLARQLAAEIPNIQLLGLDICSCDERGAFEKGARLRPNDVTQLLYTSGTTGESKGVLHTSNTLLGAIHEFARHMKLGADDVIFMPSPLAHQLGFCYGMLMPLALGVPFVLTDIWRATRAAQLIEANGATFCFAATPFLSDLIERNTRLGRMRLFASSGTTIPPAIVESARAKLGIAVAASWGMTECASITVTPPDGSRADSSDGRAIANGEVRIVGDDGREARRGEIGALQVRGASLFVGYLKRPQLYRLDPEGWFDTGDLARMDEEGYIRICGRSKDVIIRGGENIPVVEVEAALYRMPQVADAALVAMPDPRLQERACAFVTLKHGQSLDLPAIARHLAAEGFTKHFWPERLEVLAEMPRTPTGKIQKFVLRGMAKDLRPETESSVKAA